jgi:hypothetical protein
MIPTRPPPSTTGNDPILSFSMTRAASAISCEDSTVAAGADMISLTPRRGEQHVDRARPDGLVELLTPTL